MSFPVLEILAHGALHRAHRQGGPAESHVAIAQHDERLRPDVEGVDGVQGTVDGYVAAAGGEGAGTVA